MQKAKKIVFFTGAGISTESGIPDFRSADGLYSEDEFNGARPEQILSRSHFYKNPETFYKYYFARIIHAKAKPNPGHIAMSNLEKMGYETTVVTQNIDGLHEKAGSTNVLELHGTVFRNVCTGCLQEYDINHVTRNRPEIPKCEKCGSLIRPCVTLYEEALDEETYLKAYDAIVNSDVLIAVGSSLAVYPAAGLLEYFTGDAFVIINKTATPYDNKADFVFRESSGSALTRIIRELKDE